MSNLLEGNATSNTSGIGANEGIFYFVIKEQMVSYRCVVPLSENQKQFKEL